MLENAFTLQVTRPKIEAILPIAIFGSRIFSIPRSHKRIRVLWNVERLLQMLILYSVSITEFTQKTQCELPQQREAVVIAVEIAEHVVMFGAQIIVTAIFG